MTSWWVLVFECVCLWVSVLPYVKVCVGLFITHSLPIPTCHPGDCVTSNHTKQQDSLWWEPPLCVWVCGGGGMWKCFCSCVCVCSCSYCFEVNVCARLLDCVYVCVFVCVCVCVWAHLCVHLHCNRQWPRPPIPIVLLYKPWTPWVVWIYMDTHTVTPTLTLVHLLFIAIHLRYSILLFSFRHY